MPEILPNNVVLCFSQVISGIVGMFASRCANMPQLQQDYENLIVDLLKLLVESSCFKMNG
jgi:hypothetical protein